MHTNSETITINRLSCHTPIQTCNTETNTTMLTHMNITILTCEAKEPIQETKNTDLHVNEETEANRNTTTTPTVPTHHKQALLLPNNNTKKSWTLPYKTLTKMNANQMTSRQQLQHTKTSY